MGCLFFNKGPERNTRYDTGKGLPPLPDFFKYSGTWLIRTPRGHIPKCPYYPAVHIKRALRKTSWTHVLSILVKA